MEPLAFDIKLFYHTFYHFTIYFQIFAYLSLIFMQRKSNNTQQTKTLTFSYIFVIINVGVFCGGGSAE